MLYIGNNKIIGGYIGNTPVTHVGMGNSDLIEIVEKVSPYYVEYAVDNTSTKALNATISLSEEVYGYALPRIYSDADNFSYDYEKIKITLLDGTITSDPTTTCDQIAKVKVWYPENTVAIKFCRNMGDAYGSPSLFKEIYYINTSNITDMSNMFFACDQLTTLDVSNWDTSNVTTMQEMFKSCDELTSLNLSNWDTSNVTTMYGMFWSCSNLTSLDVSNWDTSNVTDMAMMFCSCKTLTSLDFSGFDTSKVTDMSDMFSNCNNITSLDISNWNTSNVTTMQGMFQNCESLISLDISNWDTEKVTDMGNMFYGCTDLISLDVNNWDTSNVTDMSWMFYNCNQLTTLDVSNFDTSNVTTMNRMFYDCTNLIELDLSSFDTSKLKSLSYIFANCQSLTSLDLSNFDASNVTSSLRAFNNCTALHTLRLDNCNNATISKTITTSGFPTGAIEGVTRTIYCKESEAEGLTAPTNWVFKYVTGYPENTIAVYTVSGTSAVSPYRVTGKASDWLETHKDNGDGTSTMIITASTPPTEINFQYRSSLLSVEYIDISNLTSLKYLFQGCSSLVSVNCSNWDTSNITNMNNVFRACTKLTSLDLSNWNTSKVTDITSMFNNCTSLMSLDLSNLDMSAISYSESGIVKTFNCGNMLTNCSSLTELRLDNCNTRTLRMIRVDSQSVSGYTEKYNAGLPTYTSGTHNIYYKKANLTSGTFRGWTINYVEE